jgi:hypothetical protein
MKSVLNIRKTIATSLLTAILAGASLVSLASGHDPIGERSSASTAEVKYINGKEGEAGIFNVVYNNAKGSRFTLRVMDADGNQLYQNLYTDKKFDKRFKLADPDSFGKLIFIIRNLDDNSTQRFEVEASSRLVEDINVKEVK